MSTVSSVCQKYSAISLTPVSTRSRSPGWWVGGGYSNVKSQTFLCLVSSTHSVCFKCSLLSFTIWKTSRNKYPFSLNCSVISNKIAISAPETFFSIGSLLICIIVSDLGFDRGTQEKLVLQRIDGVRLYPCQRPATRLSAQTSLLGHSEEIARSEWYALLSG